MSRLEGPRKGGQMAREKHKRARCVLLFLSILSCIAPAVAQVVVKDAWVRGTVEGQESTAAYMTISSEHNVTLVGAASDATGRVAIHEMQMNGGMMMMKPVERLAIPAGRPVALDGTHYHFMLEDLKRRLNVGDRVGLDLQFLDGNNRKQVVHVDARVRELDAHAGHAGMGHE